MPLQVVVHPRFGDTAHAMADETGRPQLVAEIGAGAVLTVSVDGEPGSTELAAQFARELGEAALLFAERCEEVMSTQLNAMSVIKNNEA